MCKKAKKKKKMQNETTKKEHVNTDETKLHDTINTSSRIIMKLPRL